MSNVIHGGEARSGRRIIYTASAGVAIAALLTQTTFGEWAKDRLSGVSMHDECDNFHPFYNPPAGAVVSCAPLVDRTNQQVERRVYQVVPKPNSLKALDNGDYAVAAALYHEDGVAMRFFGRSTLNLIQLDEELQKNEDTRAHCVSDMGRVVEYIQQNTADFIGDGVGQVELGSADNAYHVGPAGLGANNPDAPDLFIYDASSPKPPEQSLITCWSP